ncbi:MAG: IS607 family transposase [Desulfobacterales bacterium]|nr:IS607 family transposase [Desulfobacterales bacterium]
MKTLKEYAKEHGIKYRAAWNRYKAGKITEAYQDEFGKILLPEVDLRPEYVVCYARVSSAENKKNLDSQSERLTAYCAAKGYIVQQVIKECASGLNDKRPKLEALLKNPDITCIVVEHADRLTRFGLNYIQIFMASKGCRIEIINKAVNDKEDLMQDFVSLVTCFTARLYGLRRSKRKTEKLIKALENENNKSIENHDKLCNEKET